MKNGTTIFKWFLVINIVLFCSLNLTWANGNCNKCHENIIAKGLHQPYVHSPFAEGKCAECHLYKDRLGTNAGTVITKVTPLTREHMTAFNLKDKESLYEAVVTVRDKDGKVDKVKVMIKFDRLPLLQDTTPPKISKVEVKEIKPGVFYEATIKWVTDELSTSQVEYGEDKQFGFVTPLDETLVVNHLVKISNLAKDATYYYRVISLDVCGNKSVSPPKSFKVVPYQAEPEVVNSSEPEGILKIRDLKVSRTSDGRVVLFWLTTRLAQGKVELRKVRKEAKGQEGHANIVLKGAKESGLDSCYHCHPSEKLGISHPVGVPLGKNMKVPSGLPLAEGNIVICTSCHNAHGSKYRYYLRKSRGRELCISCHGDRY